MVTFSKYENTCVDKKGTHCRSSKRISKAPILTFTSIHLVTLSENVVLEILKLEVYYLNL